MRLVENISEMKELSLKALSSNRTVGFVPTMGYLHEGHLSLVRIAREKCELLVASIFVNPTQFVEGEDYDSYPRDMELDMQLLDKEGVDLVFLPRIEEMYPEDYSTFVEVEDLTSVLCGASRPGHFRGVTTVVVKLLNIVRPHFAVFGDKDYQQAIVVRRMVRDLNIDTDIVMGPTVREEDGLAMSSRNLYLNDKERSDATILYRSLLKGKKMVASGTADASEVKLAVRKMIEEKDTARVDYVSVVHPERLKELQRIDDEAVIVVAARFGKARLIDNIRVSRKERN